MAVAVAVAEAAIVVPHRLKDWELWPTKRVTAFPIGGTMSIGSIGGIPASTQFSPLTGSAAISSAIAGAATPPASSASTPGAAGSAANTASTVAALKNLAVLSTESALIGNLDGGSGPSSNVTSALSAAFQNLLAQLAGGTSNAASATSDATSGTASAGTAAPAQSVLSSFVDSSIANLGGYSGSPSSSGSSTLLGSIVNTLA